MKPNFRFEQTNDSAKKQNKQEVIEYILGLNYGDTVTNEDLGTKLGYNINDEKEYRKYKAMMSNIRNFLLRYGRVLKGISGLGYYILKPSQISAHCYRTYIQRAGKLYDKSEFVLDRTDKTELSDQRKEEIKNLIELNQKLIENVENTITGSIYYSRKTVYDSLED